MVSLVDERAVEFRCSDRVRSILADASVIKPKAESFDMVIGSSDVAPSDRPCPMLENMLAALRPGGLAIFYEPLQAGYFMVRQAMLQTVRAECRTPLPVRPLLG